MDKVFLVEDDPIFRETARMFLSHAGFDVEGFASAESAMEALQTRQPRALVVDDKLPGASGRELADWIAARPRLAGIPVIIVTGRDLEDQSYRFSVIATLRKPFENEELIALLKHYAGLRSPAGS